MRGIVIVAGLAISIGAPASAATFTLSLSGQVANFQHSTVDCCGYHFDEHYLPLSGLDSSNAITVSQGDTIDATVTLDQVYTIPASQVRTDFLLYQFGSSFPSENTAVNGTFTLYDGAAVVDVFNFSSSTSDALASFAAIFPPFNTAITFDSFTDDFTITSLPTSATLDSSAFDYALVSVAAPEPGAWALMLTGFGLAGATLRRRRVALAA